MPATSSHRSYGLDQVADGHGVLPQSLTHRFAAHPDEQTIDPSGFVQELITMLEAYLKCSLDEKGKQS
ncbi:MAG: hypothetical protein JW940_39350 [Polyangiaceae bacterium]|nr:hypothetical protein [Polyangiaceae bacterium]